MALSNKTWINDFYFAGNEIKVKIQTDLTPSDYDFFGIMCQIFNRGDDSLITEIKQQPDSIGWAEFELSEYLKPQVKLEYSGASFWRQLDDAAFNFDVKFNENYGVPPSAHNETSFDSTPQKVFAGGISKKLWLDLDAQSEDFKSWWIDEGKFLTFCPSPKKTFPDRKEVLYFYSKEIYAFQIEVDFEYTDGSTDNEIIYDYPSRTADAIYEINTSFSAISVFADSSKEVSKYTISIHEYGTGKMPTISNDYTYIIDRTHHRNRIDLLFKEDLPAFNTWSFVSYETKTKITRQTGENDKRTILGDIYKKETKKLYSEFLSPAEYAYLEELVKSKEVYKIGGVRNIPVHIANDNFEDPQTGYNQLILEIKYPSEESN